MGSLGVGAESNHSKNIYARNAKGFPEQYELNRKLFP